MRLRRIISIIMLMVIMISLIPVQSYAEGDTYNFYYNYYYLNDTEFDYVDIFSLNNRDPESYWRPKYDELSIPLKEYVEFKDKSVKMNKNGFDVEWSDINKSSLPTSRSLELLGYDFLLYKDIVNINNGSIEKTIGYKSPITAPYFIMNIYKALGMELYDVYFKYTPGTAECGVYVTRTNPETYWKKFLNDHPINYNVYNDKDVSNISAGQVLNTVDAITILSQMLDFYGEPILSKQEEYLLLQVYGNDVPLGLSDVQKESWSYLKSRGIIGEEELQYNSQLSFDDMMTLLMRASDKNSRTNFKEVQITTNLDGSFIKNGYFEREVNIVNQQPVNAIESNVMWNTSDRLDFLIEIDDKISFRFQDTGELNRNIFISKGPMHYDDPIRGSIFEGIVQGRFYHFSAPISELSNNSPVYLNSSNSGDYPLNYRLNNSNGGVYSNYTLNSDGTVSFSNPSTFNSIFPDSMYVDVDRMNSTKLSSLNKVYAFTGGLQITVTFATDLLNIDASIRQIEAIGGTTQLTDNGKFLRVVIGADKITSNSSFSAADALSRRLVLKDEYKYTSDRTNAIISLTGDRLLVSLNEAKNAGLIKGYKTLPDKGIIIIYSLDKDTIIVDNKNKTIQKGNTYLQIREEQPLFVPKGRDYTVDFRALYGTKEIGFDISSDYATGSTIVTMYSNIIKSTSTENNNNNTPSTFSSNFLLPNALNTIINANSIYKVGNYSYFSTKQYLPYDSVVLLEEMEVDLLFNYNFLTTNNTNIGNQISEVLIPFSSSNPMGNYILYGEFDYNYSQESYYLVIIAPKDITTNTVSSDREYKDMFRFYPENLIPEDKYIVEVIQLKSSNDYGIKNVPGVGWCYTLNKIDNNITAKRSFMSGYRDRSNLLPLAVTFDGNIPKLLNFNINYFSENMTSNLTAPSYTTAWNGSIPAPVGIQTWFTDNTLIPTLSKQTLSNLQTSTAPKFYWGTLSLRLASGGTLYTTLGSISMNNYSDDMRISGMSRIASNYTGTEAYQSPGLYMITSKDFNTTLSEFKEDVRYSEIDKRTANLQKFFEQFDDITFMNFIYGLDNSMSILYYIITRVVPLIILSLLILVLIISSVSDIRIVQLFCNKVIDPIKFLTVGHYDIHTVRSKYLIFSLIGALTIMGIIQAGNLEKIIMFFVRIYYAIMLLFD